MYLRVGPLWGYGPILQEHLCPASKSTRMEHFVRNLADRHSSAFGHAPKGTLDVGVAGMTRPGIPT